MKVGSDEVVLECLGFGHYVTYHCAIEKKKDPVNAFQKLMAVPYTLRLPTVKKETDNRHRLYNTIRNDLEQGKLGWTLDQLQTGGEFLELLTKIFWTMSTLH